MTDLLLTDLGPDAAVMSVLAALLVPLLALLRRFMTVPAELVSLLVLACCVLIGLAYAAATGEVLTWRTALLIIWSVLSNQTTYQMTKKLVDRLEHDRS